MSHTIDCQNRVVTGHAVKTIRRLGLVPAVIYGEKSESINIQTNLNAFVKVAKKAGKRELITLNLEGKTFNVKIHQADLNPVTEVFRHIDFLIVK
jgi:large subunit ribosomal protein L25